MNILKEIVNYKKKKLFSKKKKIKYYLILKKNLFLSRNW
jgi:hypothetical protein